jgi:hypothetical protein
METMAPSAHLPVAKSAFMGGLLGTWELSLDVNATVLPPVTSMLIVPSTEGFAIAEILQMEVTTYFCYCLVGGYQGSEERG